MLDSLASSGGMVGAAGVGIATGLMAGIAASFAAQDFGRLLAAQLGGTQADAKRYGQLAGDVYADGFGESLDDVQGALSAILSTGLIDSKAADADIKKLTELATTASKIVGRSAEELADAARAMIKGGIVDSADEAFDLIVTGFQRGADAGHDLVDVLTNSAVNLHRFGLDGATAIGVLKQSLDAGAPSADSFAGSLEELVGNAADGIPIFEQLGLGGEAFARKLAGGGPLAAKALDQLLDAIRNIKDPAQQSATVVALFGEEATALQDAILKVDPSSAAQLMEDFADSTKRAGETAEASMRPIEKFWRGLKEGAADAGDHMAKGVQTSQDLVRLFLEGPEKIAGTPVANSEWLDAYQERVREAANAWQEQGGEIDYVVDSLDKFISKQREAVGGVLELSEAQIGYQQALDDTEKAAKDNGRTLDLNTDKGRNNREMLNELATAAYDQIEAMQAQGASTEELTRFVVGARERFVHWAEAMGLSAGQANALADELKLIPGDYLARVHADTEQATNAVRTIHGKLVDLTNRSWIASVAVNGGTAGGRYFAGQAFGGPIGGGSVAHAAEGGARGRLVLKDEMGPELTHLPDGSTIVPAGMSRQMVSGMGGGGDVHLYLHFGGDQTGPMAVWFKKSLRDGDITLRAGSEPVTVS